MLRSGKGRHLLFESIFYLISLFYVYIVLIPSIGYNVKLKCIENRRCLMYYQRNSLGYSADNADNQYRDFKSSFGLVLCAMFLSYVLQRALHYTLDTLWPSSKHSRKLFIAFFHCIFGAAVIWVQHKWHSLFVLLLIVLSYFVATLIAPRTSYPSFYVWIFGLSVLFFKECYRYHWLQQYSPFYMAFDTRTYGGLYSWHVPANFLVLRMISFGLDLQGDTEKEKSVDKRFEFVYVLAYCLYAPLYIAGPILQYNDFVRYLATSSRDEGTMNYALRLVFAVLLMEILCNLFPFFAILKSGLFLTLSPSEIIVVSYMVLKMMWLKFLIIWRFFRLWALLDGVNPPENMLKCMSNNHSLEGFWRGWHASFNKWILKYMYVPLGGSSSKNWSVWIIFLFVAIWHDLEFKLISWGLLNSVFIIIEAAGRQITQTKDYCKLPSTLRGSLEVLFGAAYIFVLVGVNMVGYSVGVGGFTAVLAKLNSKEGYVALSCSYGILLIGVSIMRFITKFSNINTDTNTSKSSIANSD